MRKSPSSEEKEKILYDIIKRIFWMSARYAHGRPTYAPGIVRECYWKLRSLYPDFRLNDKTLEPPTEKDLKKRLVLRSDYLDDLE